MDLWCLEGGKEEMRRRTLTFSDFLSLVLPHAQMHTYQDLHCVREGQSVHGIALVKVL